mmetsp:Transcript_6021/g.7671  ORF Transcript_6021/g.7671 Transcript_6021/m.7671 type:complete len:378 (+) Transcript_6021:121-1254(+)
MRLSLIVLLSYNLPHVVAYTLHARSSLILSSSLRKSSFLTTTTSSTTGIASSTKLFAIPQSDDDENTIINDVNSVSSFNPFNLSYDSWSNDYDKKDTSENDYGLPLLLTTAAAATATSFYIPSAVEVAHAISPTLNTGEYNPENFRPVCPASDNIYRFAQGTTLSIVGKDNFVEYGPLIAGGLLRVRLELCVVESFFNEAVGPFIQKEGISWILPLHETVETFLAGTIFALASTFILVGSTKLFSVIVTYFDVFIGGILRLIGGYAFDRAKGKPVTFDIGIGPFKTRVIGPGSPKDDKGKEETFEEIIDFSNVNGKDLPIALFFGAVKAVGETSKVTREVIESIDLFVGRNLTLLATGYIAIKFLHFKVFPDFPNFL